MKELRPGPIMSAEEPEKIDAQTHVYTGIHTYKLCPQGAFL